MTIKEAILLVLENNKHSHTYLEVLELINNEIYVDWTKAKTPADTVGAELGSFIRKNDSRIKRVKGKKGFEYYFSQYESDLNLSEVVNKETVSKNKSKKYLEKDLHKLLSSYLKGQNIHSKTIFHEKSANSKDEHQKWIHPDMIGIDFLTMKNNHSNALLRIVNKSDAFTLNSYEIKREIKSDYELKKCFFQAVSNSSWSNYGYLVAFEISQNLMGEIERLSQSFGMGVIELKSNPYESKVLFHAKLKELDFKTIDKLCVINKEFESFIMHTEKMLGVSEKYEKSVRSDFERFCDKYFESDSEIEKYCKDNNIPYDEN